MSQASSGQKNFFKNVREDFGNKGEVSASDPDEDKAVEDARAAGFKESEKEIREKYRKEISTPSSDPSPSPSSSPKASNDIMKDGYAKMEMPQDAHDGVAMGNK